jgi:hypothetical protein
MDNDMCIEVDNCVFDISETRFLGFVVIGSALPIDRDKSKAVVSCPRPTLRKEVQLLLGVCNLYRSLIHNFLANVSTITDLPQQDKKFC